MNKDLPIMAWRKQQIKIAEDFSSNDDSFCSTNSGAESLGDYPENNQHIFSESGFNMDVVDNVVTLNIPKNSTVAEMRVLLLKKIESENIDYPDDVENYEIRAAEESGKLDTDFPRLNRTSLITSFGCEYFQIRSLLTNKPYAYVYMNSTTPNTLVNECKLAINTNFKTINSHSHETTTNNNNNNTISTEPIARAKPIININNLSITTQQQQQEVNVPSLKFSFTADNNNNNESIVSPLNFMSIVSPTTISQSQQSQQQPTLQSSTSSTSTTSSLSLSGRSGGNNNNNNNDWIPESDVMKCMYPNCEDDFKTLFKFKRKKCRCYKCGFIFCEKHVMSIKDAIKLSPSSLTVSSFSNSTQKLTSSLSSSTSPKYECFTCANKELNGNYNLSPLDTSPTPSPILFYINVPPLHIQLSSDENGRNAIISSIDKNSRSQIDYQQLEKGYYLISINYKSVKDDDFYDIIAELRDSKKYPLSLHFAQSLDIDLPEVRTPSNSFTKMSPRSPPTPSLYVSSNMSSKSLKSSPTVPTDQLIFPNQKIDKLLKTSYSESYTTVRSNNVNSSPSIILSPTTPKSNLVWTPDSFTDHCMYEGCEIKFGPKLIPFSERRHHCRNCGKIYCKQHSSFRLKLPGYAEPQRVCTKCYGIISTSATIL